MSARPVIWVHADALSRRHPVFEAAPQEAEIVYVWDAEDVARRGWSLKRCVFVLQCLADMDVGIMAGSAEAVLQERTVFTAATVDPHRRAVIDALNDVTVVEGPRFAQLPDGADMGRFFRYWNKAKSTAMKPTAEGADA